jgi:hypothetical protein
MRGRLGALAAKVIETASRRARTALRLAIRRRVRERAAACLPSSWGRFPGVDDHAAKTKQGQRNATRLCRGFRGALADKRAFLLRQRGEQVQDDGIKVWAEISDQERRWATATKTPAMEATQPPAA